MRLQREVPGVEESHVRLGNVAFEGLGARRQEEGIVLAPYREEGRLVGTEVLLEGRIERDVALVVAEQVELIIVCARPGEVEVVERASIRGDGGRIRHAVRVLPDGCLGREKRAKRCA